MTLKTAGRLALMGALVMAWAATAHADCARIHETIAERFARTPLVFYGEVVRVETIMLDPTKYVYRVRFLVDQAYKGTSAGEQTFEFGVSAEDFIFEDGQRVLVYAYRDQQGKFSTQCSDTHETMSTDPVLTELRSLSGR